MTFVENRHYPLSEQEISQRHKDIIAECQRKANMWKDLSDEGRYIKVVEAKLRKQLIDINSETDHFERRIERQTEDLSVFVQALTSIDTAIDDFCRESKRVSGLTNRLIKDISKVYLNTYLTMLEYTADEVKECFDDEIGVRPEEYYDPEYDIYNTKEKYEERSIHGVFGKASNKTNT